MTVKESNIMKFQDLQSKVQAVYSEKGKTVSQTANSLLKIVLMGENFPTEGNLRKAGKAEKRILDLIEDVKNGEARKMPVTLEGEKLISDDVLLTKASAYYLKVDALSVMRETMKKRIAEAEAELKSIESKIPHAQFPEWQEALRKVQSTIVFDTVSPVSE